MKLHEFEPVGESPYPRALRREDSFVLTCAACGLLGPDAAWRHFWGLPGHDARGCRVACIDLPHRITPLEASAS